MPDVFTSEKRSEVMSKIRGSETKIEVLVRKWLFSHGYRYRKNDKRYPGKPDIILPKYMTAVFIHGCFWHGHEGCKYFVVPKTRTDFWLIKIKSNIDRDQRNSNTLKEMGWNVITIWECELEKNPESRLMALLDEISHSNNSYTK